MDWQRIVLIGSIVILSFMLLLRWNEFAERHRPHLAQTETTPSTVKSAIPTSKATASTTSAAKSVESIDDKSDVPEPSSFPPDIGDTGNSVAIVKNAATSQLVRVVTDTLDILIDTHGGDIVKVALLQHAAALNSDQPYVLLNRNHHFTYIAQSGLVGPGDNGTDTDGVRPIYTTQKNEYVLAPGEDKIIVDLTLEKQGVTYIKRFSLTRGDNLIQLIYLIDNNSDSDIQVQLFGQIKRDSQPPLIATDAGFGIQPFLGAAITSPESNYEKIDFGDLSQGRETFSMQGGWVAMVQHYFLSVWVPNRDQENTFTLRKKSNEDLYLLGFTSPPVVVNAGGRSQIDAGFYAGPKDIDRLEAIADYLDLTIDFGILWWIAKPLFYFLSWINGFINNWGWSIIILTIVIKAVFFRLSAASYRSMANMRKVAPKMQAIKERYGDDRQKMSQEMMKLYKTEKVNPMGGCLPILVQMPVFIALYWVLLESVEIRHAPFILWLNDLSVKDPYFVLPLLMGVSMYIQQQLNPTPPDPTQAKIMQWLPVVFTFMFLWFPAGLVLYWVVNNTLSIIQQYIITRKIEAVG